jgi:hypothetical protein
MLCAFDIEAPPLTSYGQLCTLFYDADKPVAPDAEVAWYAKRLPQQAGPVLELMCGSGRLLVPLAAAGFKLHGVDSSAAMLGSASATPRAAFRTAVSQDLAHLNLPFRYGGAFIAAGSFQLLAGRRRAAGVAAHSRAPGRARAFVAEHVHSFDSEQRLGRRWSRCARCGWATARRSRCARKRQSGPRRGCRAPIIAMRTGGATRLAEEHETLTLTRYPPDDITAILADAGFRDVSVSDLDRNDGGATTYSVSARL